MPTIQVRTDDKTKNASTALFDQLGMTMSEAVNNISDDEVLIDAIKRYKTVNNKTDYDISKAEPFLQAVEMLGTQITKKITLQEEAVKIRINIKGQDYVLDYNFEEPDNVFILSRKNGKLIVKDSALSEISTTLELF
jgi:hypothetical protein